VDPFTNEELELVDGYLVSKTGKYFVRDNIPNFVNSIEDKGQEQVQESFGEKWTKSDLGQSDKNYNVKVKQIALDVMGITEDDLSIFEGKTVLEVGCGSGGT